jgi:hypothetical protein
MDKRRTVNSAGAGWVDSAKRLHPTDSIGNVTGSTSKSSSNAGQVVSPEPQENGRMPTPDNDLLLALLPAQLKTWLVTGVAGGIGSNRLATLPELDHTVVGLDTVDTDRRHHLDQVDTPVQRTRFRFIAGDIRDLGACRRPEHANGKSQDLAPILPRPCRGCDDARSTALN